MSTSKDNDKSYDREDSMIFDEEEDYGYETSELAKIIHAPPSLTGDALKHIINPTPQFSFVQDATTGTHGDKVVVIMVGLPARGKTYISRRLARYLHFFHDAPSKVFNIGNYRRKRAGKFVSHDFFDPSNKEGMEARKESAKEAMQDLKKWLRQPTDDDTTGKVAIYDGTNTTRERRDWILKQLNEFHADGATYKMKVMFIESICNDESIVSQNIQATKLNMPDYKGLTADDAMCDFEKRVLQYKSIYESIDPVLDAELSWVQLIDGGRMVTSNNMHGFLPGRILHFVMNLHTVPRPIYLSRHGESQYNRVGKVGGDSDITDYGDAYALKLGEFAKDHIMAKDPHCRLWTSSLIRTINTAKYIPHDVQSDGWISMRPRQWRHLDEIHAGIFDGMTYQQIKDVAPDEFEARIENKLTYRYPRGESYLDVMQRLDPIIHELERQTDPVLLVGHQGILRIIYAYFMGLDRFETPFVSIDFNTVTKLTPEAYECGVEKFLLVEYKGPKDAPSH